MKLKDINWANILTTSRILLIVPVTILLALDKPYLAVTVYIVAALTDLLDGFLARRFNYESASGSRLDGFADMVFGAFILVWLYMLFYDFMTSNWLPQALLLVSYIVYWVVSLALNKSLVYPHNMLAKVGTAAAFLLIPFFVFITLHPAVIWLVSLLLVAGRVEVIFQLLSSTH